MSHARVEELSDSDPDIDDPSTISFPQSSSSIIAPADIPPPGASNLPFNAPQPAVARPASSKAPPSKESIKTHSALYPIYFDSGRTRAQGRRVTSKLAVPNPLARDIAEACQFISVSMANSQLQIAFEPEKVHPKDWANPGRVRVLLRDRNTGRPLNPTAVKNKSHLYILVAQYLQAHPTTMESPLKLRIRGMPTPEKLEPPAVPRGWKINEILPLHSAAMSGGGMSENFLQDMVAEMQSQGGSGGGGGGSGGAGTPQMPPGMAEMLGGASSGAGQQAKTGEGAAKKKDKKDKKDKKKGK